jgi:hypothetical protein
MLEILRDGCTRFGHYIAGIGLVGIGTLMFVRGRVEIEGLGSTIEGTFARAIGLCVIIVGIFVVASGPFQWCGW